jgi:muramidase (phage lysozyme)
MGTNANLNMGAQAMMKYTQELDTLARLTGINTKEQGKIMEDAMSRASFAATIDQLLAEGKKDEANAIQQAQMYFARLGPESLRGFQDSISGFVGTTDESNNLFLASNGAHLEYIEKLKDGTLKTEKQIAEGAQGVYRALTDVSETIGRNAAMLGTSFGTMYPETRKAKDLASASIEQLVETAKEEQKKRDEALNNYNKGLTKANDEMIKNQKVLQAQVGRYQAMIEGTTTGLGALSTAATKAAEALGIIAKGKSGGGSAGAPAGGGATGGAAGGTAASAAGTAAGASAVRGPATSMGAAAPSVAVVGAGQAPQMEAIKNLIASVESNGGDYNVAVGGKRYPLTDMTINEVMKLQRELKAGPGSAMGKYQVIYGTLAEAVAKLGISRDDKFDAATQEKIGEYLIMKRGFGQYAKNPTQEGKERFLANLAAEWAGLPAGPDNKSRYAGVGNNKAGIDWTDALQKFAEGGRLGGGKYGIAGEAGPELISGPSDITPMNDLMGAFKDLLNAMATSTSILERIDRNTAASSDSSDRMLRLAQN